VLGTDDGTLVYETITAEGDDAIVIYSVDGNEETQEFGTTTTDDEAQVVGIMTEAGTNTNDEVGTVETTDDGTVKITLVGTDSGTLVYATIAIEGEDAEIITSVEESDDTNEAGTNTGLDQVDGKLIVDGT
jgi:hypothetical protein